MRICYAPGCDNAAAVWDHGAWCGKHALARPAPVQDGNPSPAGALGERPRRAASVDGVSPPPLNLTWDELAEILRAERQWWEVEHDLKVLHGMTLNDLAARLEAELEATA